MSALQHTVGQGMRLGSNASCTHSVLFGNSLLVLPCCPLAARPLRRLHLGTKAMGRKGLAELINIGKQRRYAACMCHPLVPPSRKPVCQTTAGGTFVLHRDPGRELLRPGQISPRLDVPSNILRPPYVDTGENPWIEQIQVHTKDVCCYKTITRFASLQLSAVSSYTGAEEDEGCLQTRS